MTKPIPDGFHTATPSLVVSNSKEAIEFYKKAFDANEIYQFPAPDGKIIKMVARAPAITSAFQVTGMKKYEAWRQNDASPR